MAALYQTILPLHAIVGLMGLILFWLPTVLRKGSPKHKQIGRWFIWAMVFTGTSGLIMGVILYIDPIAVRFSENDFTPIQLQAWTKALRNQAIFLLLLALLLLTAARHTVLVLRAKQHRELLRKPVNLFLPTMLCATGIYLTGIAIKDSTVLFGVFAGIALFTSISNLWYYFKSKIKRFEWVIEHLGGAFGGGIAAHTAFFVFGANRWIGDIFTGQLRLVPWILPSVIGVTAIVVVGNYYRRKYVQTAAPLSGHDSNFNNRSLGPI